MTRFFGTGHYLHAALLQIPQGFGEAVFAANGQVIQRARRSFEGIAVDLRRAAHGYYNGLYAHALGGAGNGSKVTHVGNAVEYEQ